MVIGFFNCFISRRVNALIRCVIEKSRAKFTEISAKCHVPSNILLRIKLHWLYEWCAFLRSVWRFHRNPIRFYGWDQTGAGCFWFFFLLNSIFPSFEFYWPQNINWPELRQMANIRTQWHTHTHTHHRKPAPIPKINGALFYWKS